MRNYPLNSPEAAARIVALVLISDGHVSRSEVDTLRRLNIESDLGLMPGAFSEVVQGLCEDLMASAYGQASLSSALDEASLGSLLDEVTEPELREAILRLAQAAAEADDFLAEPEAWVLSAARRHWRLDGLHGSGARYPLGRTQDLAHQRVVLATP